MDRDNTSVMSKVTATLGRNFIRSKEFQEAQLMGMDPVSIYFFFFASKGLRDNIYNSIVNFTGNLPQSKKTSIDPS